MLPAFRVALIDLTKTYMVKEKLKFSLCTPRRCRGSEGLASLILDLGTKQR
jgi:hypothetical protein